MSTTRFRSCESEQPGSIGHPEHARLLAELLDRVDLAVVAEHRERLHAPERRPGVGRVAVVAEAADRLESLVAEVGVVLAEHARRAHHLVDAGGGRERGDVASELGLELDRELERERDRRRSASGEQPATCQKCGSSSRAVAPSACESTAPTRSARIRKPPRPRISRASWRALSRSSERSMKTCATANAGSRASAGLWPPDPHLLGPDPARDVDQNAAAVALAVDVPGPVEHLLQVGERRARPALGGRRVLAHRRVDRAGVAILDATAAGPAGARAARAKSGAAGGAGRRTDWDERGKFAPPGVRAFFERARDGETGRRELYGRAAAPYSPRRWRR